MLEGACNCSEVGEHTRLLDDAQVVVSQANAFLLLILDESLVLLRVEDGVMLQREQKPLLLLTVELVVFGFP